MSANCFRHSALLHSLVAFGLLAAAGWAPPASAQDPLQMDCAIANELAGKAYKRIESARNSGNHQVADSAERGFWDVAAHGRKCQEVRAIRQVLADYNAKRDGSAPGARGGSGGGGTTGSGAPARAGMVSVVHMGTVTGIEVVSDGGADTVGSSAGGATGSSGSSAGGRTYRITVRMDDGSTRVMTQEVTPDFRSGDRVELSGGVIVR